MSNQVSDNTDKEDENEVDVTKWLILGFLGGIVISVLSMEYYGYIQHPSEAGKARIDEFVLLSLAPGYEIKVSEKPSGKEGFCLDGYLLLRPTNGKEAVGILVDAKNRPIACEQHFIPKSESDAGRE